jgi:hypothetical protein
VAASLRSPAPGVKMGVSHGRNRRRRASKGSALQSRCGAVWLEFFCGLLCSCCAVVSGVAELGFLLGVPVLCGVILRAVGRTAPGTTP